MKWKPCPMPHTLIKLDVNSFKIEFPYGRCIKGLPHDGDGCRLLSIECVNKYMSFVTIQLYSFHSYRITR